MLFRSQTKLIAFATMQKLRRFARYWDLVVNSGRFPQATSLHSFNAFWDFSEWLYRQVGRTHGIAAQRLADLLAEYLKQPVELHGVGERHRQARFISSRDVASVGSPANR